MNVNEITFVILTKNEENNISNCLNSIKKFKNIFILDSYSTDRTRQICKKYPNVKIFMTNKNLGYVDKKNFALKLIKRGFVMILDADYVVSKDLYNEIKKKKLRKNYGYKFNIYNKVNKRVIYEDLYPSKLLLFEVNQNYFQKDGHKEKLIFKGKIEKLKSYVMHYDKKHYKTWILNQEKYAVIESEKIFSANFNTLSTPDKIRKFIFLMNIVSLLYYLLYKKLFKYGLSGFIYILQRQIYEAKLAIKLFHITFLK